MFCPVFLREMRALRVRAGSLSSTVVCLANWGCHDTCGFDCWASHASVEVTALCHCRWRCGAGRRVWTRPSSDGEPARRLGRSRIRRPGPLGLQARRDCRQEAYPRWSSKKMNHRVTQASSWTRFWLQISTYSLCDSCHNLGTDSSWMR